VVLRPDDLVSRRSVERAPGVAVVDVHQPGHLPPLVAALRVCETDVFAILDDDAVPRSGWLDTIRSAFADPTLMAITGPVIDHVACIGPDPDLPLLERHRGRTWYRAFASMTWHGGAALPVGSRVFPIEHLSGGNVAFRREALDHVGFDLSMNRGAAIGYEADLALGLGKLGRVCFDTRLVVDHYPASRRGAPDRADALIAVRHSTRNLYYLAGKHFRLGELVVFLPVMWLVGQSVSPGALRWRVQARSLGLSPWRLAACVGADCLRGLVQGMKARLRRSAVGRHGLSW
jgi:GT2 family glycosyltransferase